MWTQPKDRWLKHFDFVLLDIVAALIAYGLACTLRLRQLDTAFTDIYKSTMIVIVLFVLVLDGMFSFHKDILKRSKYKEAIETLKLSTVLVTGIVIYQYLMHVGGLFSRGVSLYFWVFSSVIIFVLRLLYKIILNRHFGVEEKLPKLLLISSDARLKENIEYFGTRGKNRYKLETAVVVTRANPEKPLPAEINRVPILPDEDAMYAYLNDHVIDEVLLSISNVEDEKRIIEELMIMGMTVHINLDRAFNAMPNQYVEKMADRMVLTSSLRPFSPTQLLIKRFMDIIGGIVGVIITGILFLIFAPIIKIQSPGPVFFTQTRIGINGRKFRIYKFRSMYADAEARLAGLMEQNKIKGLMFKMDNDPRITPFGRFIRKYSIDEFPQFYNVLKGDMSLVGTRPPTVNEFEQYSAHHKARLAIKPGLTGLWQVSGRSDITDFDEVVALDLEYIRKWSLKLDIKILLKTVKVVISGHGSE